MTHSTKDFRWSLCLALVAFCFVYNYLFLFENLFYPNVDAVIHYRWARQFVDSLAQGALIPRWMPAASAGLGEPSFLYYPPLFYYAVAVADLAFGDVWISIKAITLLASIGIAISVYLVMLRLGGGHWSLAAALLVGSAPMLFAVRGMINAYPWYFSTVFLIWFVYFSLRSFDGRGALAPAVAVSLCLLVLAHILAGFVALVGVSAMLLARLCIDRDIAGPLRVAGRWGVSVALGLALAGAYLFPALLTQDLINAAGWKAGGGVPWECTFAFPLANGCWLPVLHWSIPGPVYLSALVVLAFVVQHRKTRGAAWQTIVLLLAAGGVALVLASEISYPVWRISEVLQKLHRPFRFLPLAEVAVFMALMLIARSACRYGSEWRRPILILMAGAIATTVFYQLATPWWLERYGWRGGDLLAALEAKHEAPLAEYFTADRREGWRDYAAAGGLAGACRRAGSECRPLAEDSHYRSWRITSPQARRIVLPLFHFPAWAVAVDGVPATTAPDAASGLIELRLPAGASEVEVAWRRLPAERYGLASSALALLMLGIALALRRKSRLGLAPRERGAGVPQPADPARPG